MQILNCYLNGQLVPIKPDLHTWEKGEQYVVDIVFLLKIAFDAKRYKPIFFWKVIVILLMVNVRYFADALTFIIQALFFVLRGKIIYQLKKKEGWKGIFLQRSTVTFNLNIYYKSWEFPRQS